MVLALLAPFGMNKISLAGNIAFWVTACFSGHLLYSPLFFLGGKYLQRFPLPSWAGLLLLSVIAGFLMCFVITFISWLYFGGSADYLEDLPVLFPKTFLVGVIITLVELFKNYIKHQNEQLAQQEHMQQEQQTSVKFMDKLPIDKRGTLLCLEMDDHYLKVHTDKGHHMLLMRLKDALADLVDYPGLQTHRSWWVAEEAIRESVKQERRVSLRLSNDLLVPVSRTYLPELKTRNLL
ncbi:LytTR family DNA-binding domain-containing protein [Thalassomonas haliotis]|uniref:LytTR family transcriptional regulator DNA-binding domain-containing protein n=1 Tax=Thalassomonas haliotis TaxID=485448 RepID=A0ABY7VLF4_9GAMM|nr:LytTR family DNA-binding domain-containing protein [Thalassomonas haliotis]WDE14079.1 LytTR family transcriptional regulator DNA-binding domain-containing protein [Thalassomonas haliotis]